MSSSYNCIYKCIIYAIIYLTFKNVAIVSIESFTLFAIVMWLSNRLYTFNLYSYKRHKQALSISIIYEND